MRRTLIALIGLLLAVSLLSPAVAVADHNAGNSTATNHTHTPTATPTPTVTPEPTPTPVPTPIENAPEVREQIAQIRDGPYSIVDLRKNGDGPSGSDVPQSVRALGTPPSGFVGARYRDPNLMDAVFGSPGAWQEITPDKVVQQDEIQLYGSAFGSAAGEYELVVVYWQQDTARVNNNTVPYATNQTIDRQMVEVGGGTNLYSFDNVTLRSHPDSTWRVTMWLEQDGERVDGAQWHFKHRSNPSQQSVSISSQSDLWAWGLLNIGLPGAGSVIIGLVISQIVLVRTGRGPGFGVRSWVLIVGFVGLIVSVTAYYQIAVILKYFPWVIGLTIGAIAFSAGLTIHPEEKKIGFLRRELTDAIVIDTDTTLAQRATDGGMADASDAGAEIFDELTEALKLDLPEVPAVRTEKGYRVPVEGVRPFLARIFSDAALLNVEGIATRQKVEDGRLDDIIVVDPKSEKAVEHKPAKFVRTLPWDSMKKDAEETGERPGSVEKLLAAFLTGVILVGPPLGAMALADHLLNLPKVGFLIGGIATLAISYSAEDGWIDFVPAPEMYRRAEDSLTLLQRAYSWSSEEQSARKALYEERATTASEAMAQQDQERETVTDRILERRGIKTGSDQPELEDGDG